MTLRERIGEWYARVRALVILYERRAALLGLIVGFVFDLLFFQRVDSFFENVVIILQLALGIAAVVLAHVATAPYRIAPYVRKIVPFLPFLMQFAIGGLFGKYLIFYGRSGTVLGSWPFLLLLVVLTVLNEYWRDRYKRLDFRLALLFVGLLGYTVFALPILTKTLGAWTFVASGFIALFVMALVLALVRQVAHDVTHREWWRLYMIVAGIFVVMNGLYFTNTIPPIPLALKEIGVYHSVERVGDTYIALGEDEPWYKPGTTYHKQAGEGVAVFAAVFAPSALKTTIIHRWEHKQNGAWQERARIPIAIAGGRDGGYRGYSRLGNPSPGPWRVSVLTLRGQVLGRLTFEVVEAEANLPLIEERL